MPPRSEPPASYPRLSAEKQAESRSRVGGWPIAAIGAVLVLLAFTLRYTLIPFVFAAVIGFVLDPVIDWSARHLHRHRWPAAVLITIIIVGGVSWGIWWIGHTAYREIVVVAAKWPQMIRRGITEVTGPSGFDFFGKHYAPEQLSNAMTGGTAAFLARRSSCWRSGSGSARLPD